MLRKLEKYEILDEIGHGGMATVYRGRDSRLDRQVAVKVMHPHLRGAEEARARFTREAQSVARLRHPNILEIYDNSKEESDDAFIVTELLTGPTLKVFAEAHEMPAEIAACFAIAIAQALGCAHESGIVHRDVKPENVLIHEDRIIKLTDFGIAQMVDSQTFTATGQILGSPGHMAPEQVEGRECDARTDVFSLGTVLYYLATGRLPFSGRNPHQILRRIMESDYAEPMRVRASVGARLTEIIDCALSKEPDDRYASAAEFEKELVAFVEEAGVTDPPALLAKYLKDPEAVAASFSEELVPKLLALATKAQGQKDVPGALNYLNRVLGIDEGNEQALALIDRIGRRSRARSSLFYGGGALAVIGVGAIVGAFFLPNGEQPPVAEADPPGEQTTVIEPDPETAGRRGTELVDAGTDPAAADVVTAVEPVPPSQQALPARPDLPRTRTIVFRPSPSNVSISVDGAPPRAFGPSFRQIELPVGRHRFEFIGALNCCVSSTASVNVQPGREPLEVRQSLELRPARLYVRSNVAEGDVSVSGVRGRVRTFIIVPVQRFEQQADVSVQAEGYQAWRQRVTLTAGDSVEVNANLIPTSQPPPEEEPAPEE